MKEKIKKYWWIIIIILIIGGTFYWFQWRPSQIRKECSKECGGLRGAILSELHVDCYKDCLYKKGISK